MQQAQKAGLKLGVYFYSTVITETEVLQEAEFVCNLISRYKITYPVTFDYEGYNTSNNRNSGLSKEERTNIANVFINYVDKKRYVPCFYGSKNAYENDFIINSLESCKLWVSQYPDIPYPETKKSSYTGEHHIWQHTSSGKVSGIKGSVDVNIAYFQYENEASEKSSLEPEQATLKSNEGIYFDEVYEEVTPKIKVNIRSSPNINTDDNILDTIFNGDIVLRTGKSSSSQWSRIEYEGKNAYLISKYVTTDLGDTSQVDAEKNIQLSEDGLYEIVNDNITAKDVAILRKSATVESENVGTLKNGTTLKRIGLGSNGWSKVLYNDQYVYVSTNLITTDMSYTSTEVEDVIYQDVNEQVTTKDTTNLRTSPKDGDIVMTLENGEYIKRIGIGTNNWSKLESSDGTILYGQTNLLTTD